MTLQPRFVVRTLAALSVVGLFASPTLGDRSSGSAPKAGGARIAQPSASRTIARSTRLASSREGEREAHRGAGPRELPGRTEPVGRSRVVVPAMPRPIAAASGGVYVPRA